MKPCSGSRGQSMLRQPWCTLPIVLLTALCCRASGSTDNAQYSQAVNDTDAFLKRLSDARVISGSFVIQKAGQIVYSSGHGWASEELGVPMQDYHIYPIGSNTKFFIAVAIYQLQEKGYLNVTDAVNGYIDPADFGLELPWCPQVHGREQEGCQEPTFKQLLEMSSGILATDNLGCGTDNSSWTPNDWFWQYRLSAVDIPYGNVAGINGSWLTGNSTDLDTLKLQNTLKLPLIFAPGTGYCYTNANFNLAGYVIEKLTNMSVRAYFDKYIIQPANLSNTYYWTGGPGMEPSGIRKNEISLPGYTTTFSNSSGTPKFKVVNRKPWLPADMGLSVKAAGAMYSNVFDLLKWYNLFMSQPERIGLSKQALANLTEPLNPIRPLPPTAPQNISFAQGIGVELPSKKVKKLLYTGGLWGILTHIEMWVNPNDPAKSDAVLFFSNSNPAIPVGPDGSCTVQPAGDGAPVALDKAACGVMDDGADMTTLITTSLARMWNITGRYSTF